MFRRGACAEVAPCLQFSKIPTLVPGAFRVFRKAVSDSITQLKRLFLGISYLLLFWRWRRSHLARFIKAGCDSPAGAHHACVPALNRSVLRKAITFIKTISDKEFRFVVRFQQKDGSIFTRPGPVDRFAFIVEKAGNTFLVQGLPVYTQ